MKFLMLACLAMFCPAVHAADSDFVMDGNQLATDCKNVGTTSSFNEGQCYGFVMGVEQSYMIAHVFTGVAPEMCVPDEVTNGQAVKVITKYLNDHPEELHLSGAYLTVVALTKAFPCPTMPQPKK